MPYAWIVAVSVLVTNPRRKIRLVHNPLRQTWELPGGQIEAGEPIRDGVARELLEETGREAEVARLGWFDMPEATKLAMRLLMQLRTADLMESGLRLRSYTTALFKMKSVRDFA